MLQNIAIGIYYPGSSLMHRFQARTKLLLLLWITVWMAIANQREWHFAPFIGMGVLLVVSIAIARISPAEIGRRMFLLVLISALGAIPTLFTMQNDARPLLVLGPVLLATSPVRVMLLMLGGLMLVLLCIVLSPRLLAPLRILRDQRWFKRLRRLSILYVLLMIVVAMMLLYLRNIPAGPTVQLGPAIITYGGTWVDASVVTGLLALYAYAILLTMTTSPVALVEAISMLLGPLRRLRFPVDDFALMILLALRFIPTLLEEVELLVKAQTARGADLSSGTIRERLQSLTMLFIPLMQAIFRRADELAIALEARGYQVEGQQTMLHETRFRVHDLLAIGLVLLFSIGTLLL